MTAATSILEQSIVVFSQNYLPISRVNIKRAIVLLLTGKAEPLAMMNVPVWKVRSPSRVIEVPEHIRLTFKGKERTWRIPPVNRREVLRRDHHPCQYCGSTHHLTLDHVVPLSRGERIPGIMLLQPVSGVINARATGLPRRPTCLC